jgi:hypothetical protein
MVATARRSGGWESVGAELICRDSGFDQLSGKGQQI